MPHKLQFHVVHASGEDDVHKAGDLNHHGPLAKGWQSSRFCLYPQDIVVNLDHRSRIRKVQILSHQYLIPTKIEFFVGDVPEGTPLTLENARYTRLGYVSLSDNEKTGYKARELKSVHVDAVGRYLRLNIHKNHINKHNLYNQVGIVAINVIGDEIRKPGDFNDPDLYIDVNDNRGVDRDPILEGYFNKPDYISPLDDLAFDMYQDPEIAQIIRKLERKKQEAVLQEQYDYAKRLKVAIQELHKVGEKLGKMEVEKRQAVENEDYDKARVKKLQIDEYRLQIYKDLNVHDLLESTGDLQVRHSVPLDFDSHRQPTPPRYVEIDRSPPPLSYSPTPRMPYDERPLPAMKRPPPVAEEDPEPELNQEPEPMTEVDLREASSAIDVFGYPLVSKAYSKTWSYREDALLAVYKQMRDMPPGRDDPKATMRAATFLVKRGIDDKVYAVFKAALNLHRMILTEFVPRHKIPKQDTSAAVERTIPNLFHKTGDTAVRNRDDARKFILDMAEFPEVKHTHAVPHECVKPIKLTMAPRLAQSHAEILEQLYKDLGLNHGLTLENMMGFCTVALQHNAGEVRDVTERIIKHLYRDVGAPVKTFLPSDDDKSRKNTMWRLLFEYFDKVDGKPSKSDVKKLKTEEEAKKQAEIDALQKQLQELRQLNAAKESGKEQPKPVKKKPEPRKSLAKPTSKRDDDEVSTFNTDKICIFCGERNESFNEEGLDVHYWKSCPMLKRCANCKQVVEIATYTDHLLTECEAKSNFGKCPRCTEAIPRADLDQHIADKTCSPAKASLNHCPLCHENISTGEDGWKDHLMGREGCKQNPRRLIALNKQPAAGGKAPARAGPSKIAKPTKAAAKTPR